jgi:hypothetical protein
LPVITTDLSNVANRLEVVEDAVASVNDVVGDLSDNVRELTDSVRELTHVLTGPTSDPKQGAVWRLAQHDERWATFSKIFLAMTIAASIGAGAWALKLYAIVEAVRR